MRSAKTPPRHDRRGEVSRPASVSRDGATPRINARVRRWLAGPGLLVALTPLVLAAAALGASPTPVTAAAPAALVTAESLGEIQAWLDSDVIVPDAPAGASLEAGITFWDIGQLVIAPVDRVYVRLRPATGSAAPAEGRIETDFPGHVVATLEVPKGGPGSIEVGVHGQACDSSGTCRPTDIPLKVSGTGPPPGSRVFDLVAGAFHDIVGDVVVGRSTAVTVDVVPRGLWDPTKVGLTDRVDVVASIPNDRSGATTGLGALQREGGVGTPYVGAIVIRLGGPADLAVAIPVGGSDLIVAGEHRRVNVIEASLHSSAEPPVASRAAEAPVPSPGPSQVPDPGIPVVVWILLAAVVLGGGGLLLRVLADQ